MGVSSYISPRARVRRSAIHGRGLFAIRPIRKGEIVAIKGGHILDRTTLRRVRGDIEESFIQIEDGLYIGAVRRSEVRGNKLFLNHSCQPNVGIRGQITFVALRNIQPGEELTYDWGMEENSRERVVCLCRSRNCRGVLTGQDWKGRDLQRRYKGFFSAYLLERIQRGTREAARNRR